MTIRRLKDILNTFGEKEQNYEVTFCFNPSKDVCVDYSMVDENGCSLQYDRDAGKWVAVFPLTKN